MAVTKIEIKIICSLELAGAVVTAVSGIDPIAAVELGEVIAPEKHGRSDARVQYRAVAGMDALEALGATTVNGILFRHIVEHGPCTVKGIRAERPYSDKAVQSVLWRLKHMGLVVAEEVGG